MTGRTCTRFWIYTVFGSNPELRAVAEVCASYDGKKFIDDFAKAWTKVMTNDRFDI